MRPRRTPNDSVDDGSLDRAPLVADLERARIQFHRLLAEAERENTWRQPTRGTRWTNEQLLFHMVFGYLIVQRLFVLARVLGRLPDPVSRVFARALNAATGPFHTVNYYGSCAGALAYNHNRMGARLDRVIAALQRRLDREHDDAFCRGMHYRHDGIRFSTTT